MNLTDIKNINQDIYTLDTDIVRNAKMVFVSTLVFCTLNENFRNPAKINETINFAGSANPINDLVDLAKTELAKLNLREKTYNAVSDSLDIIYGATNKLYKNRVALQNFVTDFVFNKMPELSTGNFPFFEMLYMEVDKKAKNNDKGITLTPRYAAKLMVELSKLDYKKDVVADLACGTGLFSLLAFEEMSKQLENDKKNLSDEEYNFYKKRLVNSIVANDYEAKMVTLCLANFILKGLNPKLIFNEDVFDMNKYDFKYLDGETEIELKPTKCILNPPYEDSYRPVEIVKKSIELVKGNSDDIKEKVVVICPAKKFAKKKDEFKKILNLARLDSVIKMQDDLFVESGQSPSTCIFVFDISRDHSKNDIVRFYDFSDSGFVYLKDSGMVDKNKTHEAKKAALLDKIDNVPFEESSFVRGWNNFYEVSGETVLYAKIDPDKVRINDEEADVSFENITVKKMLKEKKELLSKCNEVYKDDGTFEKYLTNLLSEEIK